MTGDGGRRAGPTEALVRVLEQRDELGAEERAVLADAVAEVRIYAAGDVLIRAHRPCEASTLLLDGLVSRQFHLIDGRRQIVAAHVAGDFVDLHGFLLRTLDHDVAALSDVRVALFPHAKLRRITETHPHLTRLLWLLTTVDAAVHREWIARVNQPATVRIAQLFCELQLKMEVARLATQAGFSLPLTQTDLGDMTGLTAVHVNRTLRKLREAGLADFRAGFVAIPDLTALRLFCEFDPTYLYLQQLPR